jgi:hypothetical protein
MVSVDVLIAIFGEARNAAAKRKRKNVAASGSLRGRYDLSESGRVHCLPCQ